MIVLAGGKATRLGPLTAQMSKALVSIQQRPIIAHHVARAVAEEVDLLTVVTSAESDLQVRAVLARMNCPVAFQTVVQSQQYGPVDALIAGIIKIDRDDNDDDFVIVTAADTYLTPEHRLPDQAFVAMAYADDVERSWCWFDGGTYVDGLMPHDGDVFIGLLGGKLRDVQKATGRAIANKGRTTGFSAMLRQFDSTGLLRYSFNSGWHDVGDLAALARAKRALFTSRSKHTLMLDERGIITKTGVTHDDHSKARFIGGRALGPHVIDFDGETGTMRMEYCDLPSLAELFLYWPGRAGTWQHIIDVVLTRLEVDLWTPFKPNAWSSRGSARDMYVFKPRDRLRELGMQVPKELVEYAEAELLDSLDPGVVHGDLNFGNILYSLGTDTFKLIDARGLWGLSPSFGDIRYEYAKLRFSYRHGLTAITHGLTVDRRVEADAIDELLVARGVNLQHVAAIEATMFLSSMPLHSKAERGPMLEAAHQCIKEALS